MLDNDHVVLGPVSDARVLVTAFGVLSITLAPVIGTKLVAIGPLAIGLGSFVFPWTWVAVLIQAHVFGHRAAARTVLALLATPIAAAIVISCAVIAPAVDGARDLFTLWAAQLPLVYMAVLLSFTLGEIVGIVALQTALRTLTPLMLAFRYWLALMLCQIASVTIGAPIIYGPTYGWHGTLSLIGQRLLLAPLIALPMAATGATVVLLLRHRYAMSPYPTDAPLSFGELLRRNDGEHST